jgi:hypothetical protein
VGGWGRAGRAGRLSPGRWAGQGRGRGEVGWVPLTACPFKRWWLVPLHTVFASSPAQPPTPCLSYRTVPPACPTALPRPAAKNFVPGKEAQSTRVSTCVLELQRLLPRARFVYCSATGVSGGCHGGRAWGQPACPPACRLAPQELFASAGCQPAPWRRLNPPALAHPQPRPQHQGTT